MMTNLDVARAFSSHRFTETYGHIAEDVAWILVGEAQLLGRDAVIAACEATARENAGVTTSWLRFVATSDGPIVAVDAVGRYSGPDGVTAVSSCDIYEFADGKIQTITSYAVEVAPADSAEVDAPA